MDRGVLITFEGGEGSGKSTHIELLRDDLASRGYRVCIVREPGGTRTGEAIRDIVLSHDYGDIGPRTELLLYEAARAQIVDEVIAPALEEGRVVLCDRFIDSTLAYQGYGRGLDQDLIHELNSIATGGIVPDCTLILDVDVDAGLMRAARKGSPDRLESQTRRFHEAVREGFMALASEEPQRVHLIDATRDKGVVSEEIAAIVDEVLDRVQ